MARMGKQTQTAPENMRNVFAERYGTTGLGPPQTERTQTNMQTQAHKHTHAQKTNTICGDCKTGFRKSINLLAGIPKCDCVFKFGYICI